jgi:transposase
MSESIVGVDISKEIFHASAIGDNSLHEEFANDPDNFKVFGDWLDEHFDQPPRVCMEATGSYGLRLTGWLVDQGIQTSVVNPARVSAYDDSELSRNNTDSSDAACIARFCQA